jgi:hypothetical protein
MGEGLGRGWRRIKSPPNLRFRGSGAAQAVAEVDGEVGVFLRPAPVIDEVGKGACGEAEGAGEMGLFQAKRGNQAVEF